MSARLAGRPVLSATRSPASVETKTCARARSADHVNSGQPLCHQWRSCMLQPERQYRWLTTSLCKCSFQMVVCNRSVQVQMWLAACWSPFAAVAGASLPDAVPSALSAAPLLLLLSCTAMKHWAQLQSRVYHQITATHGTLFSMSTCLPLSPRLLF